MEIVNGAIGSGELSRWNSPLDVNYEYVKAVLAERGLLESQVMVIWLKATNVIRRESSTAGLPLADGLQSSDARKIEIGIGNILRAFRVRYPNLKLVFVSSRIYGGWGGSPGPEPFAYHSTAPYVAWGPYMWPDGLVPRYDVIPSPAHKADMLSTPAPLTWPREDFEIDGIHPSQSGETKAGGLIVAFFKSSPLACQWFLAAGCR